jgi:hypothetical protein
MISKCGAAAVAVSEAQRTAIRAVTPDAKKDVADWDFKCRDLK